MRTYTGYLRSVYMLCHIALLGYTGFSSTHGCGDGDCFR